MNSSRLACYLYKNKFIILISLPIRPILPKAYIVHPKQFILSGVGWRVMTIQQQFLRCGISDVNRHRQN